MEDWDEADCSMVCPKVHLGEMLLMNVGSRDISHRPEQITNKRGMIVLVKNGRLDIGEQRRSLTDAE